MIVEAVVVAVVAIGQRVVSTVVTMTVVVVVLSLVAAVDGIAVVVGSELFALVGTAARIVMLSEAVVML